MRKTSNGYCIKKEEESIYLHIIPYTDSLIRIVYSLKKELPSSTIAVIREPSCKTYSIEKNIINTKKLKITVDPKTLTAAIQDLSGNIIHQTTEFDIERSSLSIKYLKEKGFYGLGEKYQWLNHKGTATSNWNSDLIGLYDLHSPIIKEMHTAVPFYIGMDEKRCHGIYFDNSYRTSFDFMKEKQDSILFQAEGGTLDYYFMYDEALSKVVQQYTWLTGTVPMPRKDFLGYQQSRYSYETSEEVLKIAKRLRQEKIPCDIIYLDIHYMEKYKVFTIDSVAFKGFKEMLNELNSMGFKVVVIIDPGVKVEKGYRIYEEGKKYNYYVKDKEGKDYVGEVWPGSAVYPDFVRKEVRNWWGSLHKDFIDQGVEGIWNDMNEPSDFSTESKTIPLDCTHEDEAGNKRSHKEIHNLYGMYEAISTYEGLLQLNLNRRPFVLTRATFAGGQRYAALWTGDNSSVWEHLESSIPMLMNLGLSGYAFAGPDVGGFMEDGNGQLLSRWTQVGAFTPFFRNHSNYGTVKQEPWAFDEETLEVTKKYINLRYQWITYLYNLMVESHSSGEPVWRPIFYHFQEDKNAYAIYDQFLFGEKVLICPIVRPFADHRMVYLPKGRWYDYWTQEKIPGGRHIIKKAPLDVLPIYIQEGGIIPEDVVKQYIDGKTQHLTIAFYTGTDGSYTLYLDDGITFDYKKGKYSKILFSIEEIGNKIMIKAKVVHKGYPLPSFTAKIYGIEAPKKIEVQDRLVEIKKEKTIILENLGENFNIIIEK